MKIKRIGPPRKFTVGFKEHQVTLKDCAHIQLRADEQVTFLTEAGGEYDVARKAWGFYATPSINSRLLRCGLKTALVRNRLGHLFVVLVKKGKEKLFQKYVKQEHLDVAWLNSSKNLKKIAKHLYAHKRSKKTKK